MGICEKVKHENCRQIEVEVCIGMWGSIHVGMQVNIDVYMWKGIHGCILLEVKTEGYKESWSL